jgi:hypothetical protein
MEAAMFRADASTPIETGSGRVTVTVVVRYEVAG